MDTVNNKGEDYERQLENSPDMVVQMLQKVNDQIKKEEANNSDVNMEEQM